MHKVSEEKMNQIIQTLIKADNAINILERAGGNRIVFLDTKKDIQKLTDELKSRYSNKLNSLNE